MLAKGAEQDALPPTRIREVADIMVTYGDLFTFIIMLCAVITLVRQHKK